VSTDNATVEADIAAIAPKLSGYVAAIHVTDNQRVKAGDILLELDASDIRPKVDQAVALVEARKAAIENGEAKLNLQKSMIAQAGALVSSARAEAERMRKEIGRYGALAKRGWVSRQRLELARADAAKADAGVTNARAGLDAQRAQLPVLESALTQARAELKQAEAQLAAAQADLGNATIKAPFDGIVGNRTVQGGQFVRAGVQVMAIVPLPAVYVIANFKETQIEEMVPGQAARISIDALPDLEFTGHIESFAPASGSLFSLLPPENATGNFTKIVQRIPVRIRVEGSAKDVAQLRAGLSVTVTVDVRDKPKGGTVQVSK
jgi:membrane fusion protein (multidrug efflux system)